MQMVSTTPINESTPAFRADDAEQATEYRTLSVLALISLVFGIASPLALAGPLFLAVPLLGVAVSLLALRNIAFSEGVLAGRWAAVAGLVLCVASAITPFSRDTFQRLIRSHQAEEVARHWLTLVASGKTEEAFRLTIEGARPQAPPPPDTLPTGPGTAAAPKTTPYETFLEQPVIQQLKALGPGAEVHLRGTLEFNVTTYRNIQVRQQYAVAAASQEVDVVLTIQRAQFAGDGMSRWLITRHEKVDSSK
jgi:hypothetical protein